MDAPLPTTTAGLPLRRLRTVSTLVDIPATTLPRHQHNAPLLGTFSGVFVPTCEFMWSVLLFVRFGVVLGASGWILALLITALCATTVVITATSIAAIATNGMPNGGVHLILDKSLGVGIGGSITLIYYLGLVILVAVELQGSADGFLRALPGIQWTGSFYWDKTLLSLLSLAFVLLLALTGRHITHRIALVFLAVLVLSLLSMLVGIALHMNADDFPQNLHPSPEHFHFGDVLSLIIPCFIGIFSGVNNASSLRDPLWSIPRGALSAVSFTALLYFCMFTFLACAFSREVLLHDITIGLKVAWPSRWLAVPGVFIVGLGASLQCLLIASNVLYSLSSTGVLPELCILDALRIHHANSKQQLTVPQHQQEPRLAMAYTCLLSLGLLFVRELETLAQLATMSFLLCYGFSNLACALLAMFRSPSWRPRFRAYHWLLSLLGFALCFTLMFCIHMNFAFLSILVSTVFMMAFTAVAYWIQTSANNLSWGQGLHGLVFHVMLKYLIAAEQEDYQQQISRRLSEQAQRGFAPSSSPHPALAYEGYPADRVWRPQIVAFVQTCDNNEILHPRLLSFISQLKTLSALCIVASIVSSEEELKEIRRLVQLKREMSQEAKPNDQRRIIEETVTMRRFALQERMVQENIEGFAKVFWAPNFQMGQRIFLRTMGIGALTPNTVVALWPDVGVTRDAKGKALELLKDLWQQAYRNGLSCLFCKGIQQFPSNDDVVYGNIDVWWIVQQGQLLLMIAYLLRQGSTWKHTAIRLFALCHVTDDLVEIEREIGNFLTHLRIKVEEVTIVPIQLNEDSLDNGGAAPSTFATSSEGSTRAEALTTASLVTEQPASKLRDKLIALRLARELEKEHRVHFNIDLIPVEQPLLDLHNGEEPVPVDPSLTSILANELNPAGLLASTSAREVHVPSEVDYHGWLPRHSNVDRLFFADQGTVSQIRDAMERHSSDASVVLFNLPAPGDEHEGMAVDTGIRRMPYLLHLFEHLYLAFLGRYGIGGKADPDLCSCTLGTSLITSNETGVDGNSIVQ